MDTRGAALRRLSRVLAALALLAGLLAMHGPTAGHDASTIRTWSADMTVAHQVPVAVGAMITPTAVSGSPTAHSEDQQVVAGRGAGHDAMDVCVAVLTCLLALLVLLFASLRLAGKGSAAAQLRPLYHVASRRPPPEHIRPSLTGLCIARV
jgi:hypothetical protein